MEEAVAAMAAVPASIDASWSPIDPRDPPPWAAVDGSHAVLVDTGAIWVVAVRAAVATTGRPEPETVLHAATADGAQAIAEAAAAKRGLTAPTIRGAEAWATFLRDLAELDAATDALRDLPEGGLLLVDGAISGLPPGPQELADRLLDRATARGVHLAGISKRSGISDADGPLLPRLHRHARTAGITRGWTRIAGNMAAVLHPGSGHAFRVDGEETVLPWLAALSNDAVYAGYPYPLAKAHNAATITQAEARRLRERLVREAGPAAWMLEDFHAVLDRNVARRA